MIYFDSSALVKRYLREAGSETVRSLLLAERAIATSKLTYPEILSAFMRKYRAGEIAQNSLRAVIDKLERDWSYFFVIEYHDELLPTVKTLIKTYPLKGADTIHLSSALWLEHAVGRNVTFVASDLTLLKAAEGENLQTINPH